MDGYIGVHDPPKYIEITSFTHNDSKSEQLFLNEGYSDSNDNNDSPKDYNY